MNFSAFTVLIAGCIAWASCLNVVFYHTNRTQYGPGKYYKIDRQQCVVLVSEPIDSFEMAGRWKQCITIWGNANCTDEEYTSSYSGHGFETVNMSILDNSQNLNWSIEAKAVTDCDYVESVDAEVILYQKENFGGEYKRVYLQRNKCKRLPMMDSGTSVILSLRVLQGCVEIHAGEDCHGNDTFSVALRVKSIFPGESAALANVPFLPEHMVNKPVTLTGCSPVNQKQMLNDTVPYESSECLTGTNNLTFSCLNRPNGLYKIGWEFHSFCVCRDETALYFHYPQ